VQSGTAPDDYDKYKQEVANKTSTIETGGSSGEKNTTTANVTVEPVKNVTLTAEEQKKLDEEKA
jgi:hypothetical protein